MYEKGFDFSKTYAKLRQDVGNEKLLKPIVSVEQLKQLCGSEGELDQILQETLEQCAKYTEDVAHFLQVEADGRGAKESGEYYESDLKRKLTHNATIDSINILARTLSRCGRDGSWVKRLADNRAAYMQFALALTFDRMQSQK